MKGAAVALGASVLVSGCGFQGIENSPLPGDIGNGAHAIRLTVDIPNAGKLTPNAQVKVGDVPVGTVEALRVADWHAIAKISIKRTVHLPANAVAKVGSNSLLGSDYLELAPPTGEKPVGRLRSGATIGLSHSQAYPSTEEVLSAASIVLNGGGLEQLGTITRELDQAFNGDGHALRRLIPRLDSFVGTLDGQRKQIYSAIEGLDRLSRKFARNRGTITTALRQIPPALAVLDKQRPHLVAALRALKKLGNVATPLVRRTKADIVGNLTDLIPTLRRIKEAGAFVTEALGFAVTFPFAPETLANACRGDYCNLDLRLDLTNQALINGFTTESGAITVPGLPGIMDLNVLTSLLGKLGAPIRASMTAGLTGLLASRSTAKPTPNAGHTNASSMPAAKQLQAGLDHLVQLPQGPRKSGGR